MGALDRHFFNKSEESKKLSNPPKNPVWEKESEKPNKFAKGIQRNMILTQKEWESVFFTDLQAKYIELRKNNSSIIDSDYYLQTCSKKIEKELLKGEDYTKILALINRLENLLS